MASRYSIFGNLGPDESREVDAFRGQYEEALDLASLGANTEAIARYTALLSNPAFPDELRAKSHNDLGCIYFDEESWQLSIESFLKSLEYNPYGTETETNLIGLMTDTRFTQALADCRGEIASCLQSLGVAQGQLATVHIREVHSLLSQSQAAEMRKTASDRGLLILQIGTASAPLFEGGVDLRQRLSPLAQFAVLRFSKLHAGPEIRDGILASLFNVEFFAIESKLAPKKIDNSVVFPPSIDTAPKAEDCGIQVTPKKHILYYSLESKSRSWFECYHGGYPSPNFTRLAEMSQVFEDMSSPGCSTAFSLSAITSGRFAHEFDRADYTGTSWFQDNLFAEMQAQGKQCYFVSSDAFIDEYWPKIYSGPGVNTIGIPESEFTTMLMAEKVVQILKESTEPCFVLSHPCPLKGCDPALKPQWRNGMERFVWDSDQALGHVLDHVDLDETTLLVCADHGNSMGENSHIFSHAFYPYQAQAAVPCFVTGAGVGRVDGSYSSIQLRELLLGTRIAPMEEIFIDTLYALQPHRVTAVRFDDWKYIAHYNWGTAVTGLQEELYDLRYDPTESRNLLADKGEHPLRSDWNSDSIRESLGGQYGYDQKMIITQLRRGRRGIADAWSRGFLKQLGRQFPQVVEQIEDLLRKSHHLGIIQSIGRVVSELSPGPHCYEKVESGSAMPTIPVLLDSLPRGRAFSPNNYSALDSQTVPFALTSS